MIDVQRAVQIAMGYCHQLFQQIQRLRLEEVELSEDEKHWFITVGFDHERQPGKVLAEALAGLDPLPDGRQYKVVDVDAQTGNVRAVKIRQPLERVS